MITFRPAIPEDVPLIEAQLQQQLDKSIMVQPEIAEAVGRTMAFTGLVGDVPIGMAGVVPKWPGTVHVWALLSPACGPYMLPITRFVRGVFDGLPQPRIEAAVLCGFEAGAQFVKLLGFEVEAPLMRKYDPAGRDHALYARVR